MSDVHLYQTIGIDVGGANLKLATPDGRSAAIGFPMWKHPEELSCATSQLLSQFDHARWLAVTMTGELADCFETRADGVRMILQQLSKVFPLEQMRVYAVGGQWFEPEQAMEFPWQVAASNWHALANWISKWPHTMSSAKNSVVVDIGSTTVDIIPIRDGQVATSARTDRDRLEAGQLVYTGLRRTPVCSVLSEFQLHQRSVPLMAELFATVDDAYLVLGLVDEDVDDLDTADGRSRTKIYAHARLARMIGEDGSTLSITDAQKLADQVVDAQVARVTGALQRNLREHDNVLVTGHGNALIARVLTKLGWESRTVWLDRIVNENASRSAPAMAVAWLWEAAQADQVGARLVP